MRPDGALMALSIAHLNLYDKLVQFGGNRPTVPFDKLRTGFASAGFILNEVKGSGSE
jgi:hypothetical protein